MGLSLSSLFSSKEDSSSTTNDMDFPGMSELFGGTGGSGGMENFLAQMLGLNQDTGSRTAGLPGSSGSPGASSSVAGMGGAGGSNWIGQMDAEAQETIANTLHIAQLSKEIAMAQALGKFMKENGNACKSMAP